jgi:hypothetical protein
MSLLSLLRMSARLSGARLRSNDGRAREVRSHDAWNEGHTSRDGARGGLVGGGSLAPRRRIGRLAPRRIRLLCATRADVAHGGASALAHCTPLVPDALTTFAFVHAHGTPGARIEHCLNDTEDRATALAAWLDWLQSRLSLCAHGHLEYRSSRLTVSPEKYGVLSQDNEERPAAEQFRRRPRCLCV